ncbi:hypothetical protein PVL30_004020 [Lodderomyces elongisporus]|uniref:uncharacterized protein n=1 Tax=Lodderomyces elongisporus TaxID=36914 RepID=UPI00292495C8|nr:uncharacterized protein PVL30_004020 [Lodderomyces elongisporus]WLF80244.1 hypothetical protein PVL30_004020 [Lodderomyces elongisporus]
MKRYQLIGRRGTPFVKRRAPEYPTAHLYSLPTEILLRIFQYFSNDPQTLIILSSVCVKFSNIINKCFLYKSIEFKTPISFFRFANSHLSSEPSNKINFVQNVTFVNPQSQKSSKHKITIAGSYAVESESGLTSDLTYTDFIKALGTLCTRTYGLQTLQFSEISPEFAFPTEFKASSSNIFKRKIVKTKRRLPKLILKSQTGWSIPLRDTHLSLVCEYFDVIDELELVNFILDAPIYSSILIKRITFTSCSYASKKGNKSPCRAFKDVQTLQLSRITNSSELSLIDLVKIDNHKLNTLVLDLSSTLFYERGEFNFTKFNPFFKLLCSGEGGYARLKTLVLVNFDLFSYLQHDDVHIRDVDSWVEPPTNNFETFMAYISHVPELILQLKKTAIKVKTCKRCGFTEQYQDRQIEHLTRDEWKHFLKPLDLQENKFRIQSHNNEILYSVSKYV